MYLKSSILLRSDWNVKEGIRGYCWGKKKGVGEVLCAMWTPYKSLCLLTLFPHTCTCWCMCQALRACSDALHCTLDTIPPL